MKLTMDRAGRIVIPKPIRDALHLRPGDVLEVDSAGEEFTLRPVRGVGDLTREHGIWVLRTGRTVLAATTDASLKSVRNDRDLSNAGTME